MFGLGMGELFFFAVIALIVLGPEKLPTAIRSVIRWTHQLKKLINTVQTDIERELEITQMRQKISAELDSFKIIEEQMQNQINQIQKEMDQIEKNKPSDRAQHGAQQSDILPSETPLSSSQSQPPETDPIWLTDPNSAHKSEDSRTQTAERLEKSSFAGVKPVSESGAKTTQARADHLRTQTV
jgi:sec-independent protein translocase protein TatB